MAQTDKDSITTYPFTSHYINILDSQIHYLDEGQGDPILFLHGIPASSYVWRHVMPSLTDTARCIAPDLIGLGKSGKPDIAYRLADHIQYIDAFIEALDLKNITLVLHAWGSVIGFNYARRHPDKIRGLAFFESHVRPINQWQMLSLPMQELAMVRQLPDKGYNAIMQGDYYLKTVLPNSILRKLSAEELAHYYAPFQQPGSCKPLWQYTLDTPVGNGPKEVVDLISDYSQWLQKTPLPKLMFYAVPGYLTTIDTVQWCRTHLSNLTLIDAGESLHYPQETQPQTISKELRDWYLNVVNVDSANYPNIAFA